MTVPYYLFQQTITLLYQWIHWFVADTSLPMRGPIK
jgi:hypothetical protein